MSDKSLEKTSRTLDKELWEAYEKRKAKVNWDLLKSWKVTYMLPKYYRFPPCA